MPLFASPPGSTRASPRQLARRLGSLGTEGAFAVAAQARALEAMGCDIVHLEIGEPDLPVAPHIVDAAVRALHSRSTKYAPPPGIPALRDAIATAARARGVAGIAAENVVVTSGAKPMLLYALLALVDPGDEILVPDPGFPIYPSVAGLAGGVPRPYPIVLRDGAFRLDVAALHAAITPRTRVIVVNSPHNPTGWVAGVADLLDMANVALEHDLWIISDEIYDGITFESRGAPSIAALPGLAARTIVVDGFSKRYAMTGFRLGYGILPTDLARHVTTLVINSTSCTPIFVQHAGLAALEGSQDCVRDLRQVFTERRNGFVPQLAAIPGIRAVLPDGAFYAFADVRQALAMSGQTSAGFAHDLLHEYGVGALPGTDFGTGGEGFLRLSFVAPESDLTRAAARLSEQVSLATTRAT